MGDFRAFVGERRPYHWILLSSFGSQPHADLLESQPVCRFFHPVCSTRLAEESPQWTRQVEALDEVGAHWDWNRGVELFLQSDLWRTCSDLLTSSRILDWRMDMRPWHGRGSPHLHWYIAGRWSYSHWEEYAPVFLLQGEADGGVSIEKRMTLRTGPLFGIASMSCSSHGVGFVSQHGRVWAFLCQVHSGLMRGWTCTIPCWSWWWWSGLCWWQTLCGYRTLWNSMETGVVVGSRDCHRHSNSKVHNGTGSGGNHGDKMSQGSSLLRVPCSLLWYDGERALLHLNFCTLSGLLVFLAYQQTASFASVCYRRLYLQLYIPSCGSCTKF